MHSRKIYVAGHTGMVGSAIVRQLQLKGYNNLLLRNRSELNLTNQSDVFDFIHHEKPDYIFLAAAKVGGIQANNHYRAEFIYENLMIQTNIIHAAWQAGVQRLLFLGSSCIYPRSCPQPIDESYLLTGLLEPTNEPYAIAKIAGIKLCESYNQQYGTNYLCAQPTNLYGPNDHYDLNNSHVLPALIRKVHEAKIRREKTLTIWGTGSPLREFLHVDDMANACLYLMEQNPSEKLINIGSGEEISIRRLALLIIEVIGYEGGLLFDATKPDGTPRKMLNINRIKHLGWKSKITLREGIIATYQDFLANYRC